MTLAEDVDARGGLRRVVHVIRSAGAGGVETHVRVVSRRLQEQGVECYVVSLTASDVCPAFDADGLRVICLRDQMEWSWRSLATIADLAKALRSIAPDLVHLHGARPAFVGGMVRIFGGRYACVTSLHGAYDLMAVLDDGTASRTRRWLAKIVHAVGFIASDRVIICARALVEDVRSCVGWLRLDVDEFLDRKVRVVYHGVESPARATQPASGLLETDARRSHAGVVVGCMTRLDEPKKGVVFLLEAIAVLQKNGVSVRLLVAGEGHSRAQLETRAAQLGLRDCKFLGYVPDSVLFLDGLDLFVLPSLSEGTPLVLMEAMLAGVAVVGTNVGGIPEVIEHGVSGIIVPAGDAEALAAVIGELSSNVEQRTRLARAGTARAEARFSASAMLPKLMVVYQEALRGRIQVRR